MTCRDFRRNHVAYIDDTLSGVAFDEMHLHRRVCERCAQLDTRVRRALLVARNLPGIQPSPAFRQRLNARLAVERESHIPALYSEDARGFWGWRIFPANLSYTVAAGMVVAAGFAGALVRSYTRDDVIQLPPVVASRVEAEPSALTTPTMVAAMPAGMPLWPAVFVAEQASWHFANDTTDR